MQHETIMIGAMQDKKNYLVKSLIINWDQN